MVVVVCVASEQVGGGRQGDVTSAKREQAAGRPSILYMGVVAMSNTSMLGRRLETSEINCWTTGCCAIVAVVRSLRHEDVVRVQLVRTNL